jgi:hypothetical protein
MILGADNTAWGLAALAFGLLWVASRIVDALRHGRGRKRRRALIGAELPQDTERLLDRS